MAIIQSGSTFDDLWGTAGDGAISASGDVLATGNFTTWAAASTQAQSPASNAIIRCTSTFNNTDAIITVDAQTAKARNSALNDLVGAPGIPIGGIVSAIGGILPVPWADGGDDTSKCGGALQILAKGNVTIGAAINANAAAAASAKGGQSGGLVVVVSGGTISGSSAISVAGVQGHDTAGAKGGGGGYSGAPGGHAGHGGSGGGGGAPGDSAGGAAGTGYIAGTAGADSGNEEGGGGGCSDVLANTRDGADRNGNILDQKTNGFIVP